MKPLDIVLLVTLALVVVFVIMMPLILARQGAGSSSGAYPQVVILGRKPQACADSAPSAAGLHVNSPARTPAPALALALALAKPVLSRQMTCKNDGKTCQLECTDDVCTGRCVQCFENADCTGLPWAPKGYSCTADNKCVANPCYSDCETNHRICGSDNCGKPCGTGCKADEYCSLDGKRCDPVSKVNVGTWFIEELFHKIAPYAGFSAIYTDDGKPLYTYQGFIDALDFMSRLRDPMYHGFAQSASHDINVKELAAFFGNAAEEMGTGTTGPEVPATTCSDAGQADTCSMHWQIPCTQDSDCKVNVTANDKSYDCQFACNITPDPLKNSKVCGCADKQEEDWGIAGGFLCRGGPPPPNPDDPDAKPVDHNGSFGMGVAALEGILPQFAPAGAGCGKYFDIPINDPAAVARLGGDCKHFCLQAPLRLTPNKSRGMYGEQPGTQDGGCFFNSGTDAGYGNYACVSSDGHLMQGTPSSIQITNNDTRHLFDMYSFDPKKLCPKGDRSCSCLDDDMACQYVGRGPTQLTGGANYTDCSMAFFGDLRLVKWPNLLTTVNRENPIDHGASSLLRNCASSKSLCESALAFPGGDLPQIIIDTTPPARVLVWAASLFFWMDKYRSGFNGVSCHDSMINPTTMGIQCVNLIVNANSCSDVGNIKSFYYQAICRALGVEPDKDVCPQDLLVVKCAKGEGGGKDNCPKFSVSGPASSCWDPLGAFNTEGSPCCCPYSQVPDKAEGASVCTPVKNRYNCNPATKACTVTPEGQDGAFLTAVDCNIACDPPLKKCESDCPDACLMLSGKCNTLNDNGSKVTAAECRGWSGSYWCPGDAPGPPGPPGPVGPPVERCAATCPKGCLVGDQCFTSDASSTVNEVACTGWNGYWCPGGGAGPVPGPPAPPGPGPSECLPGDYESVSCGQPEAQYMRGSKTCCCAWNFKPDQVVNPNKCA
jgi:hypothetical protein